MADWKPLFRKGDFKKFAIGYSLGDEHSLQYVFFKNKIDRDREYVRTKQTLKLRVFNRETLKHEFISPLYICKIDMDDAIIRKREMAE